jgi:radical SAM-linked protein
VQRLRVRLARRGRLRFTSHRDVQRALERAIRRAEVPIAFSAGFNPHPRISYAGAAPTGAASEAEYFELALHRRVDPDLLRLSLDAAMPAGLDIVDVVEAGTGSLPERLEASVWLIELPGVDAAELAAAVEAFLAADEVEVSRMTKNGLRTFDARQAVLGATTGAAAVALQQGGQDADDGGVEQFVPAGCAILRLVVRHTTPAVRPDDVLTALRTQAALAPPSPPRMTRLAQGRLDPSSATVADPLAPDRSVGGA